MTLKLVLLLKVIVHLIFFSTIFSNWTSIFIKNYFRRAARNVWHKGKFLFRQPTNFSIFFVICWSCCIVVLNCKPSYIKTKTFSCRHPHLAENSIGKGCWTDQGADLLESILKCIQEVSELSNQKKAKHTMLGLFGLIQFLIVQSQHFWPSNSVKVNSQEY